MKQFIKDCLTCKTGEHYDIGRVLWAIGVIVFLGLAVGDLIINGHFSAVDYGTGLGLVLAGGGVALKLKHKTEPE